MCGIAGFIQREPNPEALPRMLARIVHRGPDGEGVWDRQLGGWHVAIGHRRLSIIDVAGGPQPMENADGDVVLTYNGEIYNFMRAARGAGGQGPALPDAQRHRGHPPAVRAARRRRRRPS